MTIRSKFISIVSAFWTAFFSSDRREVPKINNSVNKDKVAEYSSSDSGSPKDIEDENKISQKSSSLGSSQHSLKPLFENEKANSSISACSSTTNAFNIHLEKSDYIENFSQLRGRHKALSPFNPYIASQKVFKEYVSPNPFFNYLRDFRFREKQQHNCQKITVTNTARRAGMYWRRMSPDQKVYYRAQAQAAKERLKMVASKILKRYPSAKYLSNNGVKRKCKNLTCLSYIS